MSVTSPHYPAFSLIFDLDGTLIDSQPGVVDSLRLALAAHKVPAHQIPTEVPIGPPLKELIQSVIGSQDPSIVIPIISSFKEHYDSVGFKSSRLFDGIHKFLTCLDPSVFNLFIATNKRLSPTLKILDYFSTRSLLPLFTLLILLQFPFHLKPI